MINFRLPNNTR